MHPSQIPLFNRDNCISANLSHHFKKPFYIIAAITAKLFDLNVAIRIVIVCRGWLSRGEVRGANVHKMDSQFRITFALESKVLNRLLNNRIAQKNGQCLDREKPKPTTQITNNTEIGISTAGSSFRDLITSASSTRHTRCIFIPFRYHCHIIADNYNHNLDKYSVFQRSCVLLRSKKFRNRSLFHHGLLQSTIIKFN